MPTERATTSASEGRLVFGRWLHSESSTYEVQSFLGEGTFGKVARCVRMDTMTTVAVKLIRNRGPHSEQAKQELAALQKLKMLDSDKCNLVRWNHVFLYKGHVCLEFEYLDKSLYDFMRGRKFKPLQLKEIRPIVQQVATALDQLRAVGIIHADLKLENVMLVNHLEEPFRVKVIDFGLACHVSAARPGTHLQTRSYRSPEILLGLPFTEAIDMWSLGCVAAILHTGTLLYSGSCEYDIMRFIVEMQGQPPDNILASGLKTCCFFQRVDSSTSSRLWKLKSPQQFREESGLEPKETRTFKFSSLDGLLDVQPWVFSNLNPTDRAAGTTDMQMFVDMLKGMLQLDASQRMTPHHVLEHQFISLHHLRPFSSFSSNVKSCFQLMSVCQKNLTRDIWKPMSAKQSSFYRTAQLVQPNPPPAAAVQSSQDHYLKPVACGSKNQSEKKRQLDASPAFSKRIKAEHTDHLHGQSHQFYSNGSCHNSGSSSRSSRETGSTSNSSSSSSSSSSSGSGSGGSGSSSSDFTSSSNNYFDCVCPQQYQGGLEGCHTHHKLHEETSHGLRKEAQQSGGGNYWESKPVPPPTALVAHQGLAHPPPPPRLAPTD